MLTAHQQDKIQKLMDITNRSKLLIVSILIYFEWDVDKSMDFILNTGDFLSEDLVPENRREAAEILLSQEQQQLKQINQLPSSQQDNNQKQKIEIGNQTQNMVNEKIDQSNKKNKKINQLREYMLELENQEWENKKIIQDKLSFIKNDQGLNDKLQLRIHKSLIGMKINEETGYFNCIYQLFFQNPIFVQQILSVSNQINNQDHNICYLNELKFLFGSFILSIDNNVKDSNIYVAAENINKRRMPNDQINFAQQFENHFNIINKCLQAINKQNDVSILEQTFQSFGNGQKQLYMKLVQEDRLFHLSLLNSLLKQQQTCKTYWTFEINRNSGFKQKEQINSQNNLDYWFTKNIDLEILFSKEKKDKILQIFEENINNKTIIEIKRLQQIFNSLHIVTSLQSEKDIILQETIQSLKVEKETIEKQLQKYIPFNMNIISNDDIQNSKYNYSLQATVIEIKEENLQIFYIYIYNFYEEQWYRIYNFQISIVSEDLVFNDTRKNGCFLIYIHQQQIQKVIEQQKIISEITTKIQINQGDITKELIQIQPLLKGLNDNQIEKIQNDNRAIVKIFNEELNNQLNQ